MTGSTLSLQNSKFLTVFEVSVIMRVSKRTVYRLVHAGALEAIRVNGSYRIPEYAVRPKASSLPRKP